MLPSNGKWENGYLSIFFILQDTHDRATIVITYDSESLWCGFNISCRIWSVFFYMMILYFFQGHNRYCDMNYFHQINFKTKYFDKISMLFSRKVMIPNNYSNCIVSIYQIQTIFENILVGNCTLFLMKLQVTLVMKLT